MKKNLTIILVAVFVIAGGVFLISSKSKSGEETSQPNQPTEESVSLQESLQEKMTPGESENNSTNLLSLGGSYRCTYTIEEGLDVTTYVKNGKMRTEIPLGDDDTNISLYIDNKIYQWSTKEKQGFFMSVEEAEKQPDMEVQDPDEYLEDIKNKYRLDCKNIDLANDLFAVPGDIQFQDLSQLLNQ
ncbi:MAG TPA: hypothetical protein PKH50_02490 [bacterium]|nr:hypothetical protein [bacterium]